MKEAVLHSQQTIRTCFLTANAAYDINHFMDMSFLFTFSSAIDIKRGSFSDINECVRDNGGCARDAGCVNFAGSFRCICDEGFTGDGYECRGRTTQLSRFFQDVMFSVCSLYT